MSEVEEYLKLSSKVRYGNFLFTDAIRLPCDSEIIPKPGFRHDVYMESGVQIPVVMASASREAIIDLFIDLLDPLGETVDVVLETSHDRNNRNNGSHLDLFREHIDLPVLKSILYDFEDLLLNDGCCGIAVLNPSMPLEVQLDEHKLLIAYGQDLSGFENTLINHSIDCDEELKFITEEKHWHVSSDKYLDLFNQLSYRLSVEPSHKIAY